VAGLLVMPNTLDRADGQYGGLMGPLESNSLAQVAGVDIRTAVSAWLAGAPLYEIALLNHLTGRLGRRRKGCKIGFRRVHVTPSVSVLHARGNRKDKYGADLAVTLDIPSDAYLKTALFQLKLHEGGYVKLDQDQLRDAVNLEHTKQRSFVAAVDTKSGVVKIAAVGELLDVLASSGSAKIPLSHVIWYELDVWLFAWIQCLVGVPSDRRNPDIEYVLERFFATELDGAPEAGGLENAGVEFSSDLQIVRAWLRLRLSYEGTGPV